MLKYAQNKTIKYQIIHITITIIIIIIIIIIVIIITIIIIIIIIVIIIIIKLYLGIVCQNLSKMWQKIIFSLTSF